MQGRVQRIGAYSTALHRHPGAPVVEPSARSAPFSCPAKHRWQNIWMTVVCAALTALLSCSTDDASPKTCSPSDFLASPTEGMAAPPEEYLPPIAGSLADNAYWQAVLPEADPFRNTRDEGADACPESQWQAESEHDGVWFTVETTICGYLTVAQTLLTPINAGDEVRVRVWYFTITEGEGEATLGVAIGCEPEVVWSTSMEIPTESGGLIMETWTAPRDFEAGEPVFYNVTNHGSNSWGLIELAIVDDSDE